MSSKIYICLLLVCSVISFVWADEACECKPIKLTRENCLEIISSVPGKYLKHLNLCNRNSNVFSRHFREFLYWKHFIIMLNKKSVYHNNFCISGYAIVQSGSSGMRKIIFFLFYLTKGTVTLCITLIQLSEHILYNKSW